MIVERRQERVNFGESVVSYVIATSLEAGLNERFRIDTADEADAEELERILSKPDAQIYVG